MNIGDKVRMIHHREEGIITNFLPNNVVEVEISDGFRVPVLKNEIVVIAREENVYFAKKSDKIADDKTPIPIAESGFFLAFLPFNDKVLGVHLLNNTDIEILFSIGELKDGHFFGLGAGHLKKRSFLKIDDVNLDKFEKWSPLLIQALLFKSGFTSIKEPITRRISFQAASFFKSKRKAPLLDQDAYLFQIDQQILTIKPEAIKESMTEKQTNPQPTIKKIELAKRLEKITIDLHIEQLTNQYDKMNTPQMLALQLDVFEKELDKAISMAVEEIIFIHGVGNGTLRNEIQKRLSKHQNIAFFQDAQKEKFGYGATSAKIK